MENLSDLLKKLEPLSKKRIITVTLNPVIDRTLWVPDFTPGETLKVQSTKILAAGKGVNISRALKSIGIESLATGILPLKGSNYFLEILNSDSIHSDFFIENSNDHIRTNITILSNTTKNETHLREKGPFYSIKVLNRFISKLEKITDKSDAVVFSGSLPEGFPADSYKTLLEYIRDKTKTTALDSSGSPFKEGIKSTPNIIKPNDKESEDVLGFLPDSNHKIIKTMEYYHKMGINHVLLSLGEKGLIYSNGDKMVKASVKLDKIVNSVGSGDAALAGGLAAILAKLSSYNTAAFSCAMGAANALTYGAGIIKLKDLENIFKKIKLKEI